MAKKRTPPQELLRETVAVDDGIRPVREAGEWAKDKLGILSAYLPRFAKASSGKVDQWYFADGFAGSGLNRFPDGQLRWGSTILALRAQPEFRRVIAIERDEEPRMALSRRGELFKGRAIVVGGDCNVELIPALKQHVPPWAPLLVFLDPTGFQLKWSTIEELSKFRDGKFKTELLIYLSTTGVLRNVGQGRTTAVDLSMPPGREWRDTVQRGREAGRTTAELRESVAECFRDGLEALGYRTVLTRRIGPLHAESSDGTHYHLVFATDNEAGGRIMSSIFERMHAVSDQIALPF